METPAIAVRNLSKLYRPGIGIEAIDLEVSRGEVFGFIGPNGAGKTTMIRVLLDLIRPTAGSVTVLGHDAQLESAQVRARCGYLPGELRLPPRSSGRNLLDHLARLRGKQPSREIDQLAERLDLNLDRRIGDLSKGNRQKVGLVGALMGDPELLILDEPTSGLDPLRQDDVQTMIRERAAAGRTVFLSSHSMAEVERASDRVGIIRDGRLAGIESVAKLQADAPHQTEVELRQPLDPAEVRRLALLPGVDDLRVDGTALRFDLRGSADQVIKFLAEREVTGLVSERPDLEELILRYYREAGGDREAGS